MFTPYTPPHVDEHVVQQVSLGLYGFVASCGSPPEPFVVSDERRRKRMDV